MKKAPTRGPHVRSIKVNGSDEMISRFELNRRLLEHKIDPGTVLHSPKYGKMIVQNGGSDSVPLTLVNEQGETI